MEVHTIAIQCTMHLLNITHIKFTHTTLNRLYCTLHGWIKGTKCVLFSIKCKGAVWIKKGVSNRWIGIRTGMEWNGLEEERNNEICNFFYSSLHYKMLCFIVLQVVNIVCNTAKLTVV